MTKQHERMLAFAFGVVFIVIMLVLAIAIPEPTGNQLFVFRTVLAIAIASAAAMVPGFIKVNIGNTVRAGGAIAVFAIIYFVNPATLVATPPPASSVALQSLQLGRVGNDVNMMLSFEIVGLADTALTYVEIDTDGAFSNPSRYHITDPQEKNYSIHLPQPSGSTIHARIVVELGSRSMSSKPREEIVP